MQCNHCNGILCDITECCFYEKNNKDGRLEVHFILRPELLSQNTHSRCIQRSMMRQTMPQAHLCRIECVENHIVRAKYKQHRVRSSESYLLARASTQPRGSEDQSACQSQRTVFIMCCRGVADFEFSDSFQTLDSSLQILNLGFQIADLQLSMMRDFFSTTPMKLFSTTISEMISTTKVG